MSATPRATHRLRLHLLGTPAFWLDGQPLTDFNSNKTRALLIYLAVTGQTHTRAALAGLFWGELPEEKAQTNLRKSIANLRRHLADFLLVTRQTAAFDGASDYWLDIVALAALSDGQAIPSLPAADLERAIDLYQGDFLEGFYIADTPEFEHWVLSQRRAWRNHISPFFETLLESHVRRHDYVSAMNYGLRLLALEPWREEVHRRLMLLHGRLGQRSAALKQYQRCRAALEEELGVEPDPETMALMRRIRYAPAPNDNLPPPDRPLLGRNEQLARIEALFADERCRLVTLAGPGGIGKTRLALEAARQLKHRFLEGIWFVDLTGLEEPSGVPLAIATAVNFKGAATEPLAAQLLRFLADKELLLLLDNYEQLAADTGLLVRILQGAPGVRLLVTSRVQLQLKGEHVVVLEGLPLAGEAEELFVRSVRQFRPDFDEEAERTAVTQICRLVQGSPLAIELAAAASRTYACDHIAAVIEGNVDLLQTTMADVPARHRSVRAVFDYSWAILPPDARAAFARLSIFRGGFTLPAAKEVGNVAAPQVAQLETYSLLRRLPNERYRCHALLRQYAAEVLAEDLAEQQRVASRHMHFYLALLREDGDRLLGDDSIAALERLQAEASNINIAWEHAFAALVLDELTASLFALARFYQYAGDLERYDDVLSRLVARLLELSRNGTSFQSGHLALLSVALALQATVLTFRGEFAAAVEAAQEAVDIADELQDMTVLANALVNLAGTHFRRSNYDEMKRALDQLEALDPAVPDGIEKVRGLNWRGVWHSRMGQWEEAMSWCQASLTLARELKLRSEEGLALLNIGLRYEAQNDYEAAEASIVQSLELARRTGWWRLLASAQASLALIDHRFGLNDQGEARLGEVIELFHRVGNQLRLGQPYSYLGVISYGRDRYRAGAEYLTTGLRYYRQQGNKSGEMMALSYLGRVQSALGQYEAALISFERVLALATELRAPDYRLWGHILLAELCVQLGNVTRAEKEIGAFAERRADCRDDQILTQLATTEAAICLVKGDIAAGRAIAEEGVALSRSYVPLYRVGAVARLGDVLLAEGAWEAAAGTWESVRLLRAELGQPAGELAARASLARVALAQDEMAIAAPEVEAIWREVSGEKPAILVGLRPLHIVGVCVDFFRATADDREASARRLAASWLQRRAAGLSDRERRETFIRTHALAD